MRLVLLLRHKGFEPRRAHSAISGTMPTTLRFATRKCTQLAPPPQAKTTEVHSAHSKGETMEKVYIYEC